MTPLVSTTFAAKRRRLSLTVERSWPRFSELCRRKWGPQSPQHHQIDALFQIIATARRFDPTCLDNFRCKASSTAVVANYTDQAKISSINLTNMSNSKISLLRWSFCLPVASAALQNTYLRFSYFFMGVYPPQIGCFWRLFSLYLGCTLSKQPISVVFWFLAL